MQNEQRNQRLMMSNPMNAQYQTVGNMMRANMPNGVAQNDLKRAALQNNRPYASSLLSLAPPQSYLLTLPATATPWPTWPR